MLVRPGMGEVVAGGTAGMGMTAVGMEEGAYVPLEVKVDMSGMGADKVLSKGAQEASSLLLLC